MEGGVAHTVSMNLFTGFSLSLLYEFRSFSPNQDHGIN